MFGTLAIGVALGFGLAVLIGWAHREGERRGRRLEGKDDRE